MARIEIVVATPQGIAKHTTGIMATVATAELEQYGEYLCTWKGKKYRFVLKATV